VVDSIVLIIVLGALLSLDVTLVGQFLLSRPLVVVSLFGACLGQPVAGFTLGVILELLCIDLLPLGVVVPIDTAIVAAVASGVYFMSVPSGGASSLTVAIACAFVVGLVFRHYDMWFKQRTTALIVFLRRRAAGPQAYVPAALWLNILVTYVRNLVFLAAAVPLSISIGRATVVYAPARILAGLSFCDRFLLLLALVGALSTFAAKGGRRWFALIN